MRSDISELFNQALLDDLTRSCKGFEEKISKSGQGFEFTEQSAYFFSRFTDNLKLVVYRAVDVLKENNISAVVAPMLIGAAQSALTNQVLGNDVAGVAVQGVNCALTQALTHRKLNLLKKEKDQSMKIITFFTNDAKTDFSEMINLLAIRFWKQFRFPVEMLQKGKEGSDILIDYLCGVVIESIKSAPLSMLEKKDNSSLNYIYTEVLKGEKHLIFRQSIPDTDMKTQYGEKDLKWNLRSLIENSPRIYCESYSMPGSSLPLFKFELHRCQLEKKRKGRSVDADCSYKYPPIMLIGQDELDRLANFKLTMKYEFHFPSGSGLKVNKYSTDTRVYCDLYQHASNVEKHNNYSKVFSGLMELMDKFNIASDSLAASLKNIRQASWLFAMVEVLNLINIHDKYIGSIIRNKPDYEKMLQKNARFRELYIQSCRNLEKLETACRASEKVIEARIVGVQEKISVEKSLLSIPEVRISSDMKEQYPIFQAPEKAEHNSDLNFFLDDYLEQRLRQSQISINLRSLLIIPYSFNDFEGESILKPILTAEHCDNYNNHLTQYFASMQKKKIMSALYALRSAVHYFTFGINDPIVFIQGDWGVVEQLKSHCDVLLNELDTVVNEVYNAGGIQNLERRSTLSHDNQLFKEFPVLKEALIQTKKIYDSAKEVRDDKSWSEIISESSLTKKAIGALLGGIVIGGIAYSLYSYATAQKNPLDVDKSTNADNQEPNQMSLIGTVIDNSQQSSSNPVKEDNQNKPSSDNSSNQSSSANVIPILVSCLGGVATVAGMLLINDLVKECIIKKRILQKMLRPDSALKRAIRNPSMMWGATCNKALEKKAVEDDKSDSCQNILELFENLTGSIKIWFESTPNSNNVTTTDQEREQALALLKRLENIKGKYLKTRADLEEYAYLIDCLKSTKNASQVLSEIPMNERWWNGDSHAVEKQDFQLHPQLDDSLEKPLCEEREVAKTNNEAVESSRKWGCQIM